ncbi:MAG TPA: aldose epimerase family protein [Cyclobacteriaceae bacterium]|nr:aldose epimerase family protein [Cyclobacteriaceae bacterium]
MKSSFGVTRDGVPVDRFTLKNKNGIEVSVISYGGIITSLLMPDKDSVREDIVLGFDSLSDYEKDHPFFGALIGRFGNRIAKGKFTLGGQTYTLATNNNENHLHGGNKGFDKVLWTIAEHPSDEGKAVKLTYLSKDQEEGYPGNLQAEVIYTLTDADELKIAYKATTDKPTIVNLTQHSYFNLSGNTKRDILDHTLTLYADRFVPVDKTLIPTGELKAVAGTPFDFTTGNVIGSRINTAGEQLKFGLGYDHCWVINNGPDKLTRAATLYDAQSGRQVDVFTTEPGIQFYSGNFLDGSLTGKYNTVYRHRMGLCLETQHFPDSPNQPTFPSVELKPGEVYQSQTVFKFSVLPTNR